MPADIEEEEGEDGESRAERVMRRLAGNSAPAPAAARRTPSDARRTIGATAAAAGEDVDLDDDAFGDAAGGHVSSTGGSVQVSGGAGVSERVAGGPAGEESWTGGGSGRKAAGAAAGPAAAHRPEWLFGVEAGEGGEREEKPAKGEKVVSFPTLACSQAQTPKFFDVGNVSRKPQEIKFQVAFQFDHESNLEAGQMLGLW